MVAVPLVLGLVWMDACLYFRMQSHEGVHSAHRKHAQNEQQAQNSISGIMGQVRPLAEKFSYAFHGMSVKLMMTDPVDNYIMGPLSERFADLCDFNHNFLFISANAVSLAGVVSALIAAWLVSHDSRALHKLSFVLFQLRTWFDDLDGIVARSRMGIHKHVSLSATPGYVIDGLCDTIGFAAYITGCCIYLRGTITRQELKRKHLPFGEERHNLQSINPLKPPPLDRSAEYVALVQHEDATDCAIDEYDSHVENEEVEELCYESSCETLPVCTSDGNLLEESAQRPTWPVQQLVDHLRADLDPSNYFLYRNIKEKTSRNLSNRRLVFLVSCFSLQLALCSFFWNRYILVYADLLETPSKNTEQAKAKGHILRSNIMYFLIWFWRLTNGHSFMQMFAASIFMGNMVQFLELIKYVGFVEIIVLAVATELHTLDVRHYLSDPE